MLELKHTEMKIQSVFELHGQWKLENPIFSHYSYQILPLCSHLV